MVWSLTRCTRSCWGTRLGYLAAAAGLLLSLGIYWSLGDILAMQQSIDVRFHKIEVIDVAPNAVGRILQIEQVSSPSPACTRVTQQLMYRDIAGKRFYYPLSSALNGSGFGGSRLDFTLVVPLPASIEPGDYTFVQRSIYICSWLGGFVSRRIPWQSEPQIVHVGAP
jgi:hypothetical protein